MHSMTQTNDIYVRVTKKIIDDLEKGELTWRKPWNDENLIGRIMLPLRWNDIHYTGINTIMLWAAASEKGFHTPYWMTFRQASDMKAHVRKGETGAHVVYADKIEKDGIKPDGSTVKNKIAFLKVYTVFNANQIEGLPEAFYKIPDTRIANGETRIDELENFFRQTKANIYTGCNASYHPTVDRIEMPPFESFTDAAGYYATLAHEVTHWTKHRSRLNRDFNQRKMGDEGYAREELVAELGSCFLGAALGFEPVTKPEHAAYIQSWLKVLKNDKRFIFQAASYAQKAVEYVTALQPSNKSAVIKMEYN
jgi:antirestriction protein ArdC